MDDDEVTGFLRASEYDQIDKSSLPRCESSSTVTAPEHAREQQRAITKGGNSATIDGMVKFEVGVEGVGRLNIDVLGQKAHLVELVERNHFPAFESLIRRSVPNPLARR